MSMGCATGSRERQRTRALRLSTLHNLQRLHAVSSCADAAPDPSEATNAYCPASSLVLAPGDEFTTARDISSLGVRPNV